MGRPQSPISNPTSTPAILPTRCSSPGLQDCLLKSRSDFRGQGPPQRTKPREGKGPVLQAQGTSLSQVSSHTPTHVSKLPKHNPHQVTIPPSSAPTTPHTHTPHLPLVTIPGRTMRGHRKAGLRRQTRLSTPRLGDPGHTADSPDCTEYGHGKHKVGTG